MHEEFIPIVLFLVVGAITIVALIMRYYKRQLESQEIIAAIEKGVDVKFPEKKQNRLLPGLIWTFSGIVMTLAMARVVPEDAPAGIWIWGLVPVAVGASFLIVYKLQDSKEESSED
jgi:multisubunit Na+/H+ antiporter MnhB subunit